MGGGLGLEDWASTLGLGSDGIFSWIVTAFNPNPQRAAAALPGHPPPTPHPPLGWLLVSAMQQVASLPAGGRGDPDSANITYDIPTVGPPSVLL